MLFPFSVLLLLILLFARDRFDQILSQFSQAVMQAIKTSHPLCSPLRELLEWLCNSKTQSRQLTEIAYNWCSAICENYSTLRGAKDLLLLSLEAGFRCIDPTKRWLEARLIHTDHHQKMANIVFSNGDVEAIADLLCAWTSQSNSHNPPQQLRIHAEHLIDLYHQYPSSPRLRLHIISAVEFIGYRWFEEVGVERFIRFLNDLKVGFKDVDNMIKWARLLLDTIQSSEATQCLSLPSWELLAELAVYWSDELGAYTYSPQVMISLQDAREWDKLNCWVSIVWMVWPPEGGKTTEEDLEHVMLLLLHQQPGALQKLEEQMEQWRERGYQHQIPGSFKKICKQVLDKAAEQATL